MLFNSLEFVLGFLPITLFVFLLVGRFGFHKTAIVWLVAASFFFYGWWNVSYLGLLLLSLIFNYLVGVSLTHSHAMLQANRKLLLAFGVTVNLGILGYFKYLEFFGYTVNHILGTSFNIEDIALPLAISFYTFQQIAYLVDAYRGETKEYNFAQYILFVLFFPQLIAGPIVHHKEVLPQFSQAKTYLFNWENMMVGLTIFSMGLCKKLIIADEAALYSNQIFNAVSQGTSPTWFEAWSAALHYTFQLYFDFSGYSDMAIGLALMFNLRFPLNFNSPYKAVNIIDFWRRWHITLSRFLRDYLYIPLGGNRHGKLRRYLNLMITMLLGGLWHGAGWTFIVWGGLHGIYLVMNHQWHSFRRSLGHDLRNSSWWGQWLGRMLTFIAVVVAWVVFRSENMDVALKMLASMAGFNGLSGGMAGGGKSLLLLLLIVVWWMPNTQEWLQQYRPSLEQLTGIEQAENHRWWQKLQWRPNIFFGTVTGLMIFLCLQQMFAAPSSEFLYFNF